MVYENAHYLMCKGGVYYFTRHVPIDLQQFYSTPRIVLCLKTRNKTSALRASRSIASKLDDFWLKMRVAEMQVPAADKLSNFKPSEALGSSAPKLSHSLERYLRLKGVGKSKLFFTSSKRNIGYVVECLGDMRLDFYTSQDAATFRDWLLAKGLSISSIKRIFASVRAVINLVIVEDGLSCKNAFSRTFLPVENSKKRISLQTHILRHIQKICIARGDERRLLIALLSDTGMRLSEGLGLIWSDIHLDHPIPHISLKAHPWRTLKTSGSERLIPLVGVAYQAISLMHQKRTQQFLFPSYTDEKECKGNSCSAALNKWLKQYSPEAVIHSFRHSFRDRLRNSGVQSELIDQVGGWSTKSVGQKYGNGFTLSMVQKELEKIV